MCHAVEVVWFYLRIIGELKKKHVERGAPYLDAVGKPKYSADEHDKVRGNYSLIHYILPVYRFRINQLQRPLRLDADEQTLTSTRQASTTPPTSCTITSFFEDT